MNLEEEYEKRCIFQQWPCQGVTNKIYLCVFSALVHVSESEKDHHVCLCEMNDREKKTVKLGECVPKEKKVKPTFSIRCNSWLITSPGNE